MRLTLDVAGTHSDKRVIDFTKCRLAGANTCLLMTEGPTVERHFLRPLLMLDSTPSCVLSGLKQARHASWRMAPSSRWTPAPRSASADRPLEGKMDMGDHCHRTGKRPRYHGAVPTCRTAIWRCAARWPGPDNIVHLAVREMGRHSHAVPATFRMQLLTDPRRSRLPRTSVNHWPWHPR